MACARIFNSNLKEKRKQINAYNETRSRQKLSIRDKNRRRMWRTRSDSIVISGFISENLCVDGKIRMQCQVSRVSEN